MSRFIVEKVKTDIDLGLIMKNLISIKHSDDRWRNFKPYVVEESYLQVADGKRDMEIFEDDVFVCSFPRSGTTLTQEMVWLIVNDFDFDAAKSDVLPNRFPEIVYAERRYSERMHAARTGPIDVISTLKRPRTLKSHLPVHMLPDQVWTVKPKLIYVSREVKDVAVSYFHLNRTFYHSKAELNEFLETFLKDRVLFAPYREHLEDFFKIKDYDNILYLTYEEIQNDIDESILKVCKFLGKSITAENLQKLKEHLKFDSMKKNESVNSRDFLGKLNKLVKGNARTDTFIRRGITGSHKDEMPEEFIKRFDLWINEKVKSGWDD